MLSFALLTEAHAWQKGRRGGRGCVSQDYIRGDNSHIHHTEQKKTEFQQNPKVSLKLIEQDTLSKNIRLATYKPFSVVRCYEYQ